MPTLIYFCHNCEQDVSLRDGDFICDRCGGEFIEEITQESSSDGSSHPIEMVIEEIFPRDPIFSGNLAGPRAVRTIRREEFPSDDQIISVFLNQLLSNLLPQGGAIQFQFADGPSFLGMLPGNMADYIFEDGGLDQVVTQLLNQFEGGSAPVDPKHLCNLPMTTVQQKHIESGTQCTTCMEYFTLGEAVAMLDCQHIFHRDCILPWLKRQNTCPICRKAVDASKWPSCNPLDELD